MMYLKRQGFGDEYDLNPSKNIIHIGRNSENDLVMDSIFVSRSHCEIQRIPPHGTLLIKNCSKRSVTYVDQVTLNEVNAMAELRIGSVFSLGIPLNLAFGENLNNKDFVFFELCQRDMKTKMEEGLLSSPLLNLKTENVEIIDINDSDEDIAIFPKSQVSKQINLPNSDNNEDDLFPNFKNLPLNPTLPLKQETSEPSSNRLVSSGPQITDSLRNEIQSDINDRFVPKVEENSDEDLEISIVERKNNFIKETLVREWSCSPKSGVKKNAEMSVQDILLKQVKMSNSPLLNNHSRQSPLNNGDQGIDFSLDLCASIEKELEKEVHYEILPPCTSLNSQLNVKCIKTDRLSDDDSNVLRSSTHDSTLVPMTNELKVNSIKTDRLSDDDSYVLSNTTHGFFAQVPEKNQLNAELIELSRLSDNDSNVLSTTTNSAKMLRKETQTSKIIHHSEPSLKEKNIYNVNPEDSHKKYNLLNVDWNEDVVVPSLQRTNETEVNFLDNRVTDNHDEVASAETYKYPKTMCNMIGSSDGDANSDLPISATVLTNLENEKSVVISAEAKSSHGKIVEITPPSQPVTLKNGEHTNAKRKRSEDCDLVGHKHFKSCLDKENSSENTKIDSVPIEKSYEIKFNIKKCKVLLDSSSVNLFKTKTKNLSNTKDCEVNKCRKHKRYKKIRKKWSSLSCNNSSSSDDNDDDEPPLTKRGLYTFQKNNLISDSDSDTSTTENVVDSTSNKCQDCNSINDNLSKPTNNTNRLAEKDEPVYTSMDIGSAHIKTEPVFDTFSFSKHLGSDRFEDNDDDCDLLSYSQINEVILISSDEDESSPSAENVPNSSLENVSFGPLPNLHDDHEGPSLTDLREDGEAELADLMTDLPLEGQKDTEADDDSWWPVLSQGFSDDEDTVAPTRGKICVRSPEKDLKNIINKVTSRHSNDKLIIPKLPPPLKRTEEEEWELPDLMIDVNSDDIKDVSKPDSTDKNTSPKTLERSKNIQEETEPEDDLWWPILSQAFDNDCQMNEPKHKETGTHSKTKQLKELIHKIDSREVRTTKLTEPILPPSRRGRHKKKYEKPNTSKYDKPSTSLCAPDHCHSVETTEVDDLKKDDNVMSVTEKPSNKKVKSSSSKPSTSGSRVRRSPNDLRKNLLRSHNLDMYKDKSGKPRHHLVKQTATNEEDRERVTANHTENTDKMKNISIQHKSSGSVTKKATGIAKNCKVSRTQKLSEINIFAPVGQVKPKDRQSNNKIPKLTTNLDKERTLVGQTPLVEKKNVKSVPVLTYHSTHIHTVVDQNKPNNEDLHGHGQTLKSILKCPAKNQNKKSLHIRFDENNLCSIKYIPLEKKECLGPKSMSMKEKFISDPFEIIYTVCRWNYDWLHTYKHNSNKKDTPPPVISNPHLPTFTTYKSFYDYKNTFSVLIYYELWEQIFKDWDAHQSNVWFMCQVDTNSVNQPNVTYRFSRVKMFGAINNEWSLGGKHPAVGCLIVMKHTVNHKTSFTFGYVETIQKRKTKQNTVIIYEILFSKSYIKEAIIPGTSVSISNVSYIRPSVRGFESLCKLPWSPLCPVILNPEDLSSFKQNECSEEYIIPEISLNETQRNAVTEVSSHCFTNRGTPKISLIHGPPGTGKTKVISALVSQINRLFKESELKSNRRILLCAPSNAAVNELVERLAGLKKVGIHLNIVRVGVKQHQSPQVEPLFFDNLVKKEYEKKTMNWNANEAIKSELNKKKKYCNEALEEFEQAKRENKSSAEIERKEHRMVELVRAKTDLEERCKLNLPPNERWKLTLECQKMVLLKAEVIATTLSSCLSGSFYEIFGDSGSDCTNFACCIVDEAGQSKETETWLPLHLGIKKLILVGDHLQLPATVVSRVSSGKKLHQSLFERLYHHIAIERGKGDIVHCLNVQYRMHENILKWPSMHFYHNTLVSASGIHNDRTHALKPYLLFDVIGGEERKGDGDIFNMAEVILIRSLVEAQLVHLGRLSIGILTPYQKQKFFLREELSHLVKSHNITISTIDNFQGQERDIIICSFVRSNNQQKLGFVSDKQRLNVALTRARMSCFIVCDAQCLKTSPDFQSLIADADRRGLLERIPIHALTDIGRLYQVTLGVT